jgi:MYXO-CTERM domain-containing protein
VKLIREGMEDFEYLEQAAAIDPQKTRQIALALFPTPYQCNQPVSALENARDQLFAMLDKPLPPNGDGGAGNDGGGADDGGTTPVNPTSGCGCTTSGDTGMRGLFVAAGAIVALRMRRRTARRRPEG